MAEVGHTATAGLAIETIAPGRSWADEAEEEEQKMQASTSDQKFDEAKRLEALKISGDESQTKPGEGLDEPEDSAIKAVSFFLRFSPFFFAFYFGGLPF